MFKALVIKELRESAGIVALAVLAIAYSLSELTGMRLLPWQSGNPYAYPFIYDSFSFYLALCTSGLAIALGLKQTAWEIGQGTQYFLFHRPVRRDRIFTSKLVVGLSWVIALSAATILLYAWWAATPGHVAGPFEWSMTSWLWQQWIAFPLLYLGACLSGVRPARWFGTRLVPLVAAVFLAMAAANMPFIWLTVLIVALSVVAFLIAIFYYVRERDY
jgi:hypothetical protein